MSKHGISLRSVAIAAIAAASLSLPMMSVAQAQPHPQKMRARQVQIYNFVRTPAAINGWNDSWTGGRVPNSEAWSPTDSRSPGLNPDYHGSNGG